MSVADRPIQCHARSGPLMAGGGGRLSTPGRGSPAQCFRTTAWRCRSILVRSVRVIPAGPASVVWSPVDISRPKSWPDDALNVEFAAPVWAAMTEPVALSSLAGDKTS
jgi:hypothetical protein